MMLAIFYSRQARLLFIAGTLLMASIGASLGKESAYSRSTIVIYNKNFPGSDTVAKDYITRRSIPSGNLVALDCPLDEEVDRVDYRETIELPLRRLFDKNEWWTVTEIGDQRRVSDNQIHVLVLIHGMPLKIRPEKAAVTEADKMQSDGASVDSELALLGYFNDSLSGWHSNPYFRKEVAFGDAELPELLLVGRVDGPNVASCRRMINDASEVERTGLWGRAYVDLAQKIEPGHKLGEDWLHTIITQCDRDGIPVVVDANPAAFPAYYPMDQAALYFGWYERTANGPFANPEFQLKKGAVACHIHSYSALTVRSRSAEWVGPLVDKGAAGVLGNVYEPFLQGSTHLDLFFKRLLEGYTLTEAAYMATPYLSWMSVVVGDPLYRPFDGFRTYEPQFFRKDEDLRYKTYHVATELWGNEEFKYESKLDNATKQHKTGFYYEALAGRQRNSDSLNRAISLLQSAKERYLAAEDRLRVDLQMVEVERLRNNKSQALSLLREMKSLPDYADLPGLKAVTALLNQLDPPGPSGS